MGACMQVRERWQDRRTDLVAVRERALQHELPRLGLVDGPHLTWKGKGEKRGVDGGW